MQKTCPIQAEGCPILFTPAYNNAKVCYNPACRKEHSRRYAVEKGIRERELYKKNKPVSNKRYCLGIHCRGQKMFTAIGGARMCNRCNEAIKDMY